MTSVDLLTSAVSRFLAESGFELVTGDQSSFSLIGQNESVLVFVVDASEDLNIAVERTLAALVRPFRSKSFGPKTLEMYALFLVGAPLPITQFEKYEKDVRVCRKIVLIDAEEIASRLAFLRPFEPSIVQGGDLEELFWSRLQDRLPKPEMDMVRTLDKNELGLEEVWNLLASHP